jgi:hypothetical protein
MFFEDWVPSMSAGRVLDRIKTTRVAEREVRGRYHYRGSLREAHETRAIHQTGQIGCTARTSER